MLTTLKKYGCYFVVLTISSTLFGQDDFNDESYAVKSDLF